MLCPLPLSEGKIVDSVPWVVIEIMSPDDRFTELQERFRDYKRIGVRHIVMLDPENLIAFRFEEGSLLKTSFTVLELPSGSLPFVTDALFEQLVEKRNEGRP